MKLKMQRYKQASLAVQKMRLPAFCPFRAAAAFFFGRPAERRGGFFHPWLLSEVRLGLLSGRLRGRDGSLVRRVSANRSGNGRTGPTDEGIKQTSASDKYRGVAQLVARLLWEQDAAGSNPVTPTSPSVLTAFEKVATAQMLNIQKFILF